MDSIYNLIPGITIRVLEKLEEYQQAEEAQRLIWRTTDPHWIVPSSLLLTAQKNGGLVLGAYDEENTMQGMLFGFMGLSQYGKLKHCSHMMGVMPAMRRQNIGQAMKRFQREFVRAQGIDLITWTFDPLEGVNASLNIARLGGIVQTYHPNLYGRGYDSLNSDLPTDRFEVEWWITSEHVDQFADTPRHRPTRPQLISSGAELINVSQLDEDGIPQFLDQSLNLNSETLLYEIPSEFQAIKVVSLDSAVQWREQTAAAFTHYFDSGYVISDFVTDRDDGYRRNFYVLSKNTTSLIQNI